MKLDGVYADTLVQKIMDYSKSADIEITTTKAVDLAMKYIAVVIDEIARNYHKRTDSDRKLDLHNVSLNALRNKCGRYGPRNKEKYWWPILHKISPLINIVEKGNNLSMALTKVQAMFENDWEEAAVWTIKEEYTANPDQYDMAIIDLESLGNWMLQAPRFYKSKIVLERVLKQAERVFAIAEQFKIDDQFGQLPMLRRPAPSGRLYYGGINLQNCASAVRHAALGQHYSYDLKRSVFSWQVSMLRMIIGENEWGHPEGTLHTREFIKDRNAVMERLAVCFKDTYLTPEQINTTIKGAITAIGFGGRRSGGFVNKSNEFVPKGLATVIKDKDARTKFMNHPWVKGFVAEQDAIIKIITEFQIAHDPTWLEDERTQHNGRYNAKVFISNLYQGAEARVMKDLMKRYADKEVLLWVHDGFCTRHPINTPDAVSIMQYEHNMRDWDLDVTQHKAWQDPDRVKVTPEQQRALNEQQDRLERAERHKAELAMWAERGMNVSGMHNQPLPTFNNTQDKPEGYYDGN